MPTQPAVAPAAPAIAPAAPAAAQTTPTHEPGATGTVRIGAGAAAAGDAGSTVHARPTQATGAPSPSPAPTDASVPPRALASGRVLWPVVLLAVGFVVVAALGLVVFQTVDAPSAESPTGTAAVPLVPAPTPSTGPSAAPLAPILAVLALLVLASIALLRVPARPPQGFSLAAWSSR